MSWLNNFTYEESKDVFTVDDGEWPLCIKEVKEMTSQKTGARMLCIFCNLKAQSWNGIQYRHFIMEGEYFDKNLSRFMDCFGLTEINPNSWINSIGKAKFDHFKYNSETKKSETVADQQVHLVKKAGFKMPEQPAVTASQPVIQQTMPAAEDIPF